MLHIDHSELHLCTEKHVLSGVGGGFLPAPPLERAQDRKAKRFSSPICTPPVGVDLGFNMIQRLLRSVTMFSREALH